MSSELVSINEVEQNFLSDKEMYLNAEFNDIFTLQIYHSEMADAKNNECVLILMTNPEEGDDADEYDEEFIILESMRYPLAQIIEQFKIDRDKAMWVIDYARKAD
jgi:hypothetical protein